MNNFDQTLHNLLEGVDEEGLETTDITEVPEMTPIVYVEKNSALAETENADLSEDYKFARSNLYGLIGKANAALEMTLKIAQMTESTKCMDTASQILNVSNQLTKSLLDLQKQIKDSKPKEGAKKSTFIQNNNFYSSEEQKEVNSVIDQLDDEE